MIVALEFRALEFNQDTFNQYSLQLCTVKPKWDREMITAKLNMI